MGYGRIASSVMYTNPEGTSFIDGDSVTEGSHRFAIDTDTGDIIAQVLISDIWQPAPIMTGSNTIKLKYVGLGAMGEHIVTKLANMKKHFHAHSHYNGTVSDGDARIVDIYESVIRDVFQPDNTGVFTGKSFSFVAPVTESVFVEKFYFQTDVIVPTSPVTIKAWMGDVEGALKDTYFKQEYPPSEFPTMSEIDIFADGGLQFDDGQDYFVKMECDSDFSLKTNAAVSLPWLATDDANFREDDMLQRRTYTTMNDGVYSFTAGEEWVIYNRKIYVCNATGPQTGDFASNIDKWDTLGSSSEDYWKKTGTEIETREPGDNVRIDGLSQLLGSAVIAGGKTIGETWNAQDTTGNDEPWSDEAYGGGVWVVVGDDAIMTSDDGGVTWTTRTPPVDRTWHGVTFIDDTFVVVCRIVHPEIAVCLTSNDGGVTWDQQTCIQNSWYDVTNGNGVLVAVGISGAVMTSVDKGVTWVNKTSGNPDDLEAITFGEGVFVAVGWSDPNIMVSDDDGETWDLKTIPAGDELNAIRDIAYGNGVFIAVTGGYTANVFKSIDLGNTWTAVSPASVLSWFAVAYGEGVFAAVSSDGSTEGVMISTDFGDTWTTHSPAVITNSWRSVAFGNDRFLSATGVGTNDSIMTSVLVYKDGTLAVYGVITVNKQIKGVVDPSEPQDAATKNYADIHQMVSFTGGLPDTSVARRIPFGDAGTTGLGPVMPLSGTVKYLTLSTRLNNTLTVTLRKNDIDTPDTISLSAEQTKVATASTTFVAGDRLVLFKEGTTQADALIGTFFVVFDD